MPRLPNLPYQPLGQSGLAGLLPTKTVCLEAMREADFGGDLEGSVGLTATGLTGGYRLPDT